jgi:hypothetical protein
MWEVPSPASWFGVGLYFLRSLRPQENITGFLKVYKNFQLLPDSQSIPALRNMNYFTVNKATKPSPFQGFLLIRK